MNRILVYSISSFLTATGGYFFVKTPQENFFPNFKKTSENKKSTSVLQSVDDAFPSASLISVDKFGNILITDKSTQSKKVIYPNGQVKTFESAETYDTSPSYYGSAPMAAGMGWGGGGVYGTSDYGGHTSGSSGGGDSQAQAVSIKKGKGQASSEEETEKKEGRTRELASDSLGASGGLGTSGSMGQGLMGGSPFSSPASSGNSGRAAGESEFLAMATAGEKQETPVPTDQSLSNASSGTSQTDTVNFQETPTSDESKSNDPQYITVPGAKKASNQKSSGPPPQAPDRRQNAKKAEDSANNAIPPIMNNANEEKKKAEEEREKKNFQKAQEHDAKAAMLMAQAAAMAAAAAGNNKAKNKAGNDDGGGSSGPLIQTPLIFNYGDNQPKNEPQENSQPQVIAVYPNAPNNKSPASSEIILANPNAVQ